MDASIIKGVYEEVERQSRLYFDFYNPHPKQLEFHTLGKGARHRMFLAGNRTGKSFCCSMEVCMHLTGNYPEWWPGYRYDRPVNVWVGGVTNQEVFGIIESRYFEGVAGSAPWIDPSLLARSNRTNHIYHVRHTSGQDSKLRFKSYEQKARAWQGEQCDIIHLDEEPTELQIYEEASMRLMSTSPGHRGSMLISATCLLWSPFVHSFLTEVVEENGEKKEVQRVPGKVNNSRVFIMAGWEDAPHLTETEKIELKANMSPATIEARTTGMPSIGSGMVYPISESVITCAPFEIPKHFYCVAGMDFGWHDPTALVFLAIDRDKNIGYVFHEYSMSEKTPEQHVYYLNREKAKDYIGWIPIVHDPAGGMSSQKDGENLVDLYRAAGFKNMNKADNSREPGAQLVLQRLQNMQLKIFSSCNRLLSELRMYARDKDGKIKDGNDHLLDALRYAVMSGWSLAQTKDQLCGINDGYYGVAPKNSWMSR